MDLRIERGRKLARVYYSPQAKQYTLYQDGMTNAATITLTSPYESGAGAVPLTHKVEEEWGIRATAALTDRNASYPEVVMKWSWEASKAMITDRTVARIVVELQAAGPQPDVTYVDVTYLSLRTGKPIDVREKVKTWRHLDKNLTLVGVLVFATVDLVPGETDAGVILRLLDQTGFSGYKTILWSVEVALETASLERMSGERIARLMDVADLLQDQTLLEIGCSASRINSISSYDSLPDLAALARAVQSDVEVIGNEELPEPAEEAP